MLAPLPLEQARSSLEFWRERRSALPFYRLTERREADEMIHRWRARVASAERARFGTGLFGLVRRVLTQQPPAWPLPSKPAAFALVWSFMPRRLAMFFAAALGAYLVAAAVIGLGLTLLVLRAT